MRQIGCNSQPKLFPTTLNVLACQLILLVRCCRHTRSCTKSETCKCSSDSVNNWSKQLNSVYCPSGVFFTITIILSCSQNHFKALKTMCYIIFPMLYTSSKRKLFSNRRHDKCIKAPVVHFSQQSDFCPTTQLITPVWLYGQANPTNRPKFFHKLEINRMP